jgi:hypothetical protein
MGSAFETACFSLSMWTTGNIDDVREMLARIGLWHFNLGECDPARLSDLALDTLANTWPPDEGTTEVRVTAGQRDQIGQVVDARLIARKGYLTAQSAGFKSGNNLNH